MTRMRVVTILLIALIAGGRTANSQSLVPDSAARIPAAIGGGGSAFRLSSTFLGESRSILIGLPRSFSSTSRKYPVIIVFDGEANFRPAMTVVSELAGLGHIPESIVIGIPNTDRLRDLTPPGLSVSGSSKSEGGDRFLDFLEKELVPAVGRQFRGAGPVVLVGHSSGGILATYAAATRPAFRFILSLDGPTHLGNGWLVDRMVDAARNNSLERLRYVSLEARFGWTDSVWNSVKTVAPVGWLMARQKLEQESHVSMPFVGTYVGLRELFKDYAIRSAPQSPTTSTLAHYRALEKSYGASIVPPSGLLRQVVEDLEMEGQAKAAMDAWNMLVTGYGAPSDSAEWQERLDKLSKMPPLTETVEGLLATPAPKTAAARHLLGEWSGHQWLNPEDKNDMILRLRDSAGVVVGEAVYHPAPNVEHIQKLTYIKIVDGGVDFGFMNGMRPRGMLVSEGRLKGDVLSGQVRFGGIRFVPPPGIPNGGRIMFELKRQGR